MTQLSVWRGRIKRAKKRGYFTGRDKRRACAWPTCVIGEKYDWDLETVKRIGMQEHHLGIAFSITVGEDEFDRALAILETIEAIQK